MMNTVRVETRDAWRAWLSNNHSSETEIWFVFYRKHTGVPNVPYGEAVEEALCFGWIDSLVKRIDDERYAQKFTPRCSGSVWSESNKKRATAMMDERRMTDAGLFFVDEAKASGEWDRKRSRPSMPTDELPEELSAALESHSEAARTYHALAPTYQKQYILWIATAKRAETRRRRTSEAIEKLERGERLGLK
ncbi:YdeI family protein [Candidatus Bipolaricaulota bacterium]